MSSTGNDILALPDRIMGILIFHDSPNLYIFNPFQEARYAMAIRSVPKTCKRQINLLLLKPWIALTFHLKWSNSNSIIMILSCPSINLEHENRLENILSASKNPQKPSLVFNGRFLIAPVCKRCFIATHMVNSLHQLCGYSIFCR